MTPSGTLVLIPDVIGDSIMSLPALNAFDQGGQHSPVTAVAPGLIVELLEGQFPHWQWQTLESWVDEPSCAWETAVDFAGLTWSARIMANCRSERRMVQPLVAMIRSLTPTMSP